MRYLCLFLALMLAGCDNVPSHLPMTGLTITTADGGTVRLGVEIADDDAERAQGLMGRPILPEDKGMLFIFEKEEMQSFWMHNTLVPLDMIFADSAGRIVFIHHRAKPMSDDQISSRFPVKMVLEVNAGLAKRRGIAVGDTITVDKTGGGN